MRWPWSKRRLGMLTRAEHDKIAELLDLYRHQHAAAEIARQEFERLSLLATMNLESAREHDPFRESPEWGPLR